MIEAEQRPTCETCPYWDQSRHLEWNPTKGQCTRFPPQVVSSSYSTRGSSAEPQMVRSEFGESFPITDRNESCGEHPDMNEWIARRREKALHDKHVAWAKEFQHGQRVMHCDGSKGRVIGQHGDDNEKVNVQFDDGVSLSVKPRDIVKIDEDKS